MIVTIVCDLVSGFHTPRGSIIGKEYPSARLLSTSLSGNVDMPDPAKTLATMQWGQFIAHDMAHTVVSKMCKYFRLCV